MDGGWGGGYAGFWYVEGGFVKISFILGTKGRVFGSAVVYMCSRTLIAAIEYRDFSSFQISD